MNVPVASLSIKKKVMAICLVFVEVKAPDVTVIPYEKNHGRITGGARCEREKVPHIALILSSSWLCKLKFEKKVVAIRGRAVLKPDTELEPEIVFIHHDR